MTAAAVAAYDAVVLAGGQATRLGGIDKPMLQVAGMTLLDRVLAAASTAANLVVVGPERPTARVVRWTREDPPGGGPAAGVAAALPLLDSAVTVLLAGDLGLLAPPDIDTLVAAVDGHDGAVAVDSAGEPQWLLSAWSTERLRTVPWARGMSLRATLGPMRWVAVPALADVTLDCDSPDDVRRVTVLLEGKAT